MLGKYVQEIALKDRDNALEMAKVLVEEGYVVQLSREEKLWILDFESTFEYGQANRNGMVFMSVEEFDDRYYEKVSDDDLFNEELEG